MKAPRLLRYRLGTILALTALLACCFAWVTERAILNHERRQAVERIWRFGGSIEFVGEAVFERPISASDWALVNSRGWIYDAIHSRTATQVIFVNYIGYPTTVNDDDIPDLVSAIRQLPEITEARLDATRISRSGMEQMRSGLPDVRIWTPKFDSP